MSFPEQQHTQYGQPPTDATGQFPANSQYQQPGQYSPEAHHSEILRQGFVELLAQERSRNRRLSKISTMLLPWTIIGWLTLILFVLGIILNIIGLIQLNSVFSGA